MPESNARVLEPSSQPRAAPTAVATARSCKPRLPSAYEHYQKLMRDFDTLEREMQNNNAQQNELDDQLERARAQERAVKAEQLDAQRAHWERERDRQVEAVVQQSTALQALRAETDALEAQELTLLAEMEAIRDKQREANETEARRVRRLVHDRTSLLEDELVKGKMDLDYITQVVAAKRKQQTNLAIKTQTVRASSTVQKLVDDVQVRRRQEFEAAVTAFQARMHAFELEKQELARKAQELRTTKKRALEILSQNQQQAIKGFFDAPPSGNKPRDERAHGDESEVELPSLDFGDILQSLRQSGTQVEHIQTLDSERNSAQRELADALQDARSTLERGPGRLEDIERLLECRKEEARALGIDLEPREAEYDGAWGVESYAPRQYETVYFLRSLVFAWMDTAVAEVDAQPATALLEVEVKRWQTVHTHMEHERERSSFQQLSQSILEGLVTEVVREMAEDIRLEFQASVQRVRGIFTNVFDTVFFAPASEVNPPHGKKKAKSQYHPSLTPSPGQPALRPALFASSFNHMRAVRGRRGSTTNDSDPTSRQTHVLLHQRSQPVIRRERAELLSNESSEPITATGSPSKKAFGLFRASHKVEPPAPNRKMAPPQAAEESNSSKPREKPNESVIPVLTVDTTASAPRSPSSRRLTTFWENEPELQVRSITMASSFGCCSCIHFSSRGDLLACGTTVGELVLWDLLPVQPVVLRVWTPAKPQRCRVMRLELSLDSQLLVAFNTRKIASVFAINPRLSLSTKSKVKHSDDCFPADVSKFKARTLELVEQIAAPEAVAEPSFTPELCERVPAIVAKVSDSNWSPSELRSANFFASFSPLGLTSTVTSVLCGSSTGDLIKFNFLPEREASRGLFGPTHGIQAAFDAPEDADGVTVPSSTTIRREFFRGHQHPILFASCIQREGSARPTEVLSVDQGAHVCLWEYSTSRFAGFGWFEPTQTLRLDLQCPASEISTAPAPNTPKRQASKRLPPAPEAAAHSILKGEVLQIALTPDDSRLVFMVFHADPTKKDEGLLRFLQIVTASMKLAPVKIQIAFPGSGSGAPRFALTINSLLLLLDNRVHVLGLRTGKPVREPIVLNQTQGKQRLTFSSISSAVISTGSTTIESHTKAGREQRERSTMAVHFAVASDQHPRLLVHSFARKRGQHSKAKSERDRRAVQGTNPAH